MGSASCAYSQSTSMGTGPMKLLALRSPWVVTGVTAKAAQSTASCPVRATRALTCAAAAGSRSRMACAYPVAMDTGSNAARPLGGRYAVQALEAGAQGAQALGGLHPRRSPH